MDKRTSKTRYWLYKALEIVTVLLPLVILILFRHDKYVYSKSSAQGLTIGGTMAVVVIVLTALGKLHLKGLGWSVLLLVMTYFLKNVLDDLLLILLCVVIGQICSRIFQYLSKMEGERVMIERNAHATAVHTEEVIKKYHKSGRV